MAYHRYHEYIRELMLEGLKSKVVSTGFVGSAGLCRQADPGTGIYPVLDKQKVTANEALQVDRAVVFDLQ